MRFFTFENFASRATDATRRDKAWDRAQSIRSLVCAYASIARSSYFAMLISESGSERNRVLADFNLMRTKYKTTSLPRLVTPAKVPDMAAQLQGMFRTPWGFVSAKIKFLTVGSRRNGHPQI